MSTADSPVIVFAYKRADKLKNCLTSLEKCKEAPNTDLFLFCDGPKNETDRSAVEAVHKFAHDYSKINPFKTVTINAREKNLGLAASIISGVTEVINKYGRAIVVEDDLVVQPSFLTFLNEGLEQYSGDDRYGSISAFTYPMKVLERYGSDVYATQKAECWGWATWSDRWNNAEWKDTDFDSYLNDRRLRLRFERLEAGLDRLMYLQYKGNIDSWAVRWVYYLFRKGQLTIYPVRSHVSNEGFDGSGTHCTDSADKGFALSDGISSKADTRWIKCDLDSRLAKEYARFPRRFLPIYYFETLRYLLMK